MRRRDLDALELPRVLEHLSALAVSPRGCEECLRLAPETDRSAIESRLDELADLVALCREGGEPPLLPFPDVATALKQAAHEGFLLDGESLLGIATVLEATRRMRRFLDGPKELGEGLGRLRDRLRLLPDARRHLRLCLDDEGGITDQADPELAATRRSRRVLQDRLSRRLERLLNRADMRDLLIDHYVTVRNNRFVLPLKTAVTSQFDGVVQDRSVSGETAFVEPLFAVELNNEILLLAKEEEALVRRVLAQLTDLVRAHLDELAETHDALAHLDVLCAKRALARRIDGVRPGISDDQVDLRQARHPTLLLGDRTVVPVDISLAPGKRALVITGPNTGGKTVALKTLGLCTLMAQCGLFVPVDGPSCLPCFDAVFTDVGDEQSIDRDLSTFSAHMVNLKEVLAEATVRSLVLLDEPGVGTDPEDGAALGIATIEALVRRGARVAVTTHYSAIKAFALAEESCATAAVEIDVETMQPLYRLVPHSIGESLAFPIAERLGLPASLLDAARSLRSTSEKALGEAMSELEKVRRDFEQRAHEANELRRKLRLELAEAERERTAWREKRRRQWQEGTREVRSYVREVRDRGKELLAEVESGKRDRRRFYEGVHEQEAEIREREPSTETPERAAPSLAVGDSVFLRDSQVQGELIALQGERAWIQRGSMRFEVPLSQLRPSPSARPEPAAKVRVQTPSADAEIELDLRGYRAHDALAELERFLDRAFRAGVPRIRIVHGYGSGALRKAVLQFLEKSSYCRSAQAGEANEGGAGVTIAELDT